MVNSSSITMAGTKESGNKIPRRIPSHLPVIPLSAVNTKTMTDRISRRRHDSKKH